MKKENSPPCDSLFVFCAVDIAETFKSHFFHPFDPFLKRSHGSLLDNGSMLKKKINTQ